MCVKTGYLEIVQPLPGHQIAIEGERIKITCVAQDLTENVSRPDNITFLKVISRFGDTKKIADEGPNGNYTFENKTEGKNSSGRIL